MRLVPRVSEIAFFFLLFLSLTRSSRLIPILFDFAGLSAAGIFLRNFLSAFFFSGTRGENTIMTRVKR